MDVLHEALKKGKELVVKPMTARQLKQLAQIKKRCKEAGDKPALRLIAAIEEKDREHRKSAERVRGQKRIIRRRKE